MSMSLIKTIDTKSATGDVAAIYEQVQKQMGMVPNGLKAFSTSTHRLKAQVAEIGYYMAHPTLSAPLTAAIRYIVAREYDCPYCVVVNGGMLKQAGWSEEVVDSLPQNPGAAQLEAKDKAMLLAAIKAVRTPKEFGESDMQELRALGWADGDILDAVAHATNSMAFDRILAAFDIAMDEHK
jgi:uncharacterized peroxidase-related enzyme